MGYTTIIITVVAIAVTMVVTSVILCRAGQPPEEAQFSYAPASAALQVYSCSVLITIGAALCFSSRQRSHLQSVRNEDVNNQFIQQGIPANNSCTAADSEDLIQPLLPESAV